MSMVLQELNELSQEECNVFEELLDSGWSSEEAQQMIVENREAATEDGQPEVAERFAVTDMPSANWVLKQIAEAEKSIDEIHQMIDAEVESIKTRGQRILQPLQNKIKFFETAYGTQLETWADQELKGKKTKSINLLHGKIGFRKSPDKVVLDVDDEAAIEELKLLGRYNCIRVKEEINKTELKKELLDPQNICPGRTIEDVTGIAHIEPGSESFYFKAEAPE